MLEPLLKPCSHGCACTRAAVEVLRSDAERASNLTQRLRLLLLREYLTQGLRCLPSVADPDLLVFAAKLQSPGCSAGSVPTRSLWLAARCDLGGHGLLPESCYSAPARFRDAFELCHQSLHLPHFFVLLDTSSTLLQGVRSAQ